MTFSLSFLRILFILLSWLLLTSVSQAQNTPTKAAASATSQIAKDIIGVWAFVRNQGEPSSTDKKVKIILDKHWMFSQPDPKTSLTLFHHGGTYLLDGNSYAETIEYANETTGGLLGRTFRYEVTIKGDTMNLTGIGSPWNEVWRRVK